MKLPLYVIAFCCGAIVMGFELLGSRMLSPYFGDSIFVWGSLISVFMLGLSAGYFSGGLLASFRSNITTLSLIVFIPALFITIAPWFFQNVCDFIFEMDLGPRGGPLLACVILFTLPSLFLGAVSPYLVQLLVKNAELAGRGAGTLYAISTCGSIFGTLGTSFYLILWLGTKNCLLVMGVSLLVLSLLIFIWGRLSSKT